jgi:hypothetical protein
MPIDPSVIVFPRAVFLGVNPVEPFIQINIEGTPSLVTDGNSRQEVRGRVVSRIGQVEHVQDCTSSLEDNSPTAACPKILTPTLQFVINLQKKSTLQLSFL